MLYIIDGMSTYYVDYVCISISGSFYTEYMLFVEKKFSFKFHTMPLSAYGTLLQLIWPEMITA